MDTISKFLISDLGSKISCGIIGLFAVFFWIRFEYKCYNLGKQLKYANKKLKELIGKESFFNGYEGFNKWVKEYPLLGHTWNQFAETLIFPPENDLDKTILNSHEASDFFNDHSIIQPGLNIRFYNAIPNYLTGLGILGTFVGLVAGIYLAQQDLRSEDIEIVKEGLRNLLSGASLAFWTSIVGLITSIPFSMREKCLIKNLQKTLAGWNDLLDKCVKRVTPEQLASDQLKETREQTVQLKRFNDDLAVTIANALDEKIVYRLAPSISTLIDAVNGLRNDRGETNEKLLTNLLNDFKNSLSGSVGSEMTGVGETIKRLNDTLNITLQNMADEQITMKETTKKLTLDLASSLEQNSRTIQSDMGKLMNEILNNLNSNTKIFTGHIEAVNKQASDNINGIMEGFSKSVGRLTENTSQTERLLTGMHDTFVRTEQLCNTLQNTHHSFSETIKPLREGIENISLASLQTLKSMEAMGIMVEKLEQTHGKIDQTQEHLIRAWTSYCERFENVDSSLEKVFKEIQEGLSAYTHRVNDFVVKLDNHMSKGLGDLAGVINELHETTESLGEQFNNLNGVKQTNEIRA